MTRVTYDADPGVTPERGDFLRTKRGILRVIVGGAADGRSGDANQGSGDAKRHRRAGLAHGVGE
jgi:hypothetical protein